MSGRIDKTELIARLTQFSETLSRNHIAFVSQCDDVFRFVDVGIALSKELVGIISDNQLSLKARDCLNDILSSNMSNSEAIGNYLAIKNIGVLFEPILKLDIEALFNRWSQNIILIVDMGQGSVVQDKYYLSQQTDQYSIDLHEMNYIALK